MTSPRYLLPNGAIPVLLSADTPELVPAEAAAVLAYAISHPEVAPHEISDMLFRTRIARRHRALAMVSDREQLLDALRAVSDGGEHPVVVRSQTPAAARRLAYVFPGQGSQRPGMGRLFYDAVSAFRAEVDRCSAAFADDSGVSPLDYLLEADLSPEDSAGTVQPALFTQMAGLAAMWRAFGVSPSVTIGHSQGEIAAAYVSGLITLPDAVRIIGIRSRAADEIGTGDYAMAVVAADRDSCEDLLARSPGWAELTVVNSPNMTGISGDRATVQDIVDTLTERGTFARVIRVQYPAHTSMINRLGDQVRTASQRELQNQTFLEGETDCLGATLGGPVTGDLPMDQYWFWNLRNPVRFDKAIAAAVSQGIDTFVELAEHPTLQLAIHENLAAASTDEDTYAPLVVGTSNRSATDLGDLTRNLAELAVGELNYSWDVLKTDSDGPTPLPLLDFPNTVMNDIKLWMRYDHGQTRRDPDHAPQPIPQAIPAATTPARLLAEDWIRLTRRSLVPPRAIAVIDHTGECTQLANALCAAASDVGATARVVDLQSGAAAEQLSTVNTQVILLPQSPELTDEAAAAQVATFFGDRGWWPGVTDAITDCWLVTVGGEAVSADDPPPDLVHAAASAGFRSVGAKYLGVGFRHLDLPAGSDTEKAAPAILAALHTGGESELALRDGALYAKRIVKRGAHGTAPAAPNHVVIVGGTGNLGLEFCDYFARSGARRITLVSRSGETPAVADRLRRIRSTAGTQTETQIQVSRCDVGEQAAVSLLAEELRDSPADLILHAAVQYSGIELEDITADLVDQALRPKVVGIWRVLNTLPRTPDCRVVLCSSISATVGGRGVIVYAAANRMLDAMAHRLRAEGVDCTAVQWGHWNVHPDLDGSAIAKLSGTGVIPMNPSDALAIGMSSAIRSNAVVATFDLDRARSVLETCGRGSLLSQLDFSESNAVSTVAPPAPDAPVRDGLSQRLMSLLAGAIGVDRIDTIDTTIPMVAIGLDSLQALELRRRVKDEFDHELEVSDLLSGASIADVLAKLGG